MTSQTTTRQLVSSVIGLASALVGMACVRITRRIWRMVGTATAEPQNTPSVDTRISEMHSRLQQVEQLALGLARAHEQRAALVLDLSQRRGAN